ncbi:hypothetical protein NGRA_0377 [Nosema granulosis]|uniref:Uncharacterized protein n=1 Tax=Nosema granulosis TaxID=83296 RepID=A0A9P6H3N5_9MICR|nr:hypothetical protein NGRA_0377 [Nosema granulosis]
MRNVLLVSFLFSTSQITEESLAEDSTAIAEEFLYVFEEFTYKKTPLTREKESQLVELFSTGNIFNTSNYDITINGKTYFTILRLVLEKLIRNEDALRDLIGSSSISRLRVFLEFVYYSLYVSKGNVASLYKKIDLNQDCGSIETRSVLEIFLKTLIGNVLGNQMILGYNLEHYPTIYKDIKGYYEDLTDYKKYKIEVISHVFGQSHTTVQVFALEYIFIAIQFSLKNTLQFIDRLPQIIPQK